MNSFDLLDCEEDEMYVVWRKRPSPAIMMLSNDPEKVFKLLSQMGCFDHCVQRSSDDRHWGFTIQDDGGPDDGVEMDFALDLCKVNDYFLLTPEE
jgi:hypothetical protein